MKMLLIVCPDGREAEIRAALLAHGVHAYSEMRDVTGEGATGPRMGTRVWPGASALIFTVIPEDKKDELAAALRAQAEKFYPSEGLRIFVLPVEEMF